MATKKDYLPKKVTGVSGEKMLGRTPQNLRLSKLSSLTIEISNRLGCQSLLGSMEVLLTYQLLQKKTMGWEV